MDEPNSIMKEDTLIALDYMRQGNEKLKMKDYEGALSDYDRTLEINPAFVKAYVKRGLIKYMNGDLPGAETEWDSAWEWECKR
ncbi:MAG: tetratricopeptide repeat protein [Candidatus Aureabacteria bacterium]|nr:tetratricopeptide repeat protein [Candidatus Auribacterota bacterium]